MNKETPQIVETKETQVASLKLIVPRSEIQNAMGPALTELHALVAGQGLAPIGPWLSHHFRMLPDVFDFEICLPVAVPVRAQGRVAPGILRSRRVARAVMHGGYEGLGEAWGELRSWAKAAGNVLAEDLWEVYVKGPESGSDSAAWRTELNQPLE